VGNELIGLKKIVHHYWSNSLFTKMCYSLNIPPFLKFGIYSAVLFLYLALGTVFFYFTETHDIGKSTLILISKQSLLFTGEPKLH
jgi:hypothetical protein